MGSGFAFDGFKRLQYTLALKKVYRNRYKDMKEAVSKINSKYSTFHDRSNLTPEELKKYKKKIKSRIIYKRQKVFVTSFLITILLVGIISFLSVILFNYFLSSF